MKKITLLLLMLLCTFARAQTYNFDQILTINSTNLKKKDPGTPAKIVRILNSKDSSYEMFVKGAEGLLFDYEKNVIHKFLIQKAEKNTTDFIFQNSVKYSSTKLYHRIEKVNEDVYLIQMYFNKKILKPNITLLVKLKESEDDLIYLEAHASGKYIRKVEQDLKSLLDPTKKYVVENIKIEYDNGHASQMNYQNFEKINLNIKAQ